MYSVIEMGVTGALLFEVRTPRQKRFFLEAAFYPYVATCATTVRSLGNESSSWQ